MNFKERTNPTVVTKALLSKVPLIIISKEALTKMYHYVQECADEIGWLGTAYKQGREILIADVYLFDQEVHATTTEITPQGLATFAENILQREDGVEIWNNLKMWGHSHVNMGVTPSGQDDKQMETFAEGGHDWFIRLIANKKGELKVDLYDYEHGIIFTDLPWEEQETAEELSIHMKIQALYRELDALKATFTTESKEPIKEEIKQKVRKKTWGTTNYAHSYQQQLGFQANQKGSGTTSKADTTGTKKKEETKTQQKENNVVSLKNSDYDYFETDDQVRDELDFWDLVTYAKHGNVEELEDALWMDGWANVFTTNDLSRIMSVSKQLRTIVNNMSDEEIEGLSQLGGR
jgi:hypothetical protein